MLPYHIIPGKAVFTTDLPSHGLNLTTLDTFDATPLKVYPWATGVTSLVTSPNILAYVLKANIKAGASVIHVIDRLLFPYNPWGTDTSLGH